MTAFDRNEKVARAILARVGRGISIDDAQTLRRASLTLHRWAELECGDGNDYASWAIERDESTVRDWECGCGHKFTAKVILSESTPNLSGEATVYCPKCNKRPLIGSPHRVEVGLPYMVTRQHNGATRRHRIPDRERGALRRVAALCESAGLHFYHQTDPRGCALYIAAEPMSDCDYSTKGVAIC